MRGLVLLTFLSLVLVAPARAQERADSTAADPDTGWVEIGGQAGFGSDDPFADLPSAEDEGPVQPEGGRLFPYLGYNRVDQFTIGLDMTFKPSKGWLPGLAVRMAYAAERKHPRGDGDGRWLYAMRLEQPLDTKRNTRVAIATYRITDDDGFGQVGDVENTLAAFFFHYDYKDWFEREGFNIEAATTLKDRWTLSARYDQDDYSSITELADNTKGVFRRGAEWRANPAVDDGDLRTVTGGLDYDSRINKKSPRNGMLNSLRVETAGGSLGGQFDYIRYLGDLRAYFSPGPSHVAKARVMAGTTSEGDFLPFQRTFAIGGIGTLRGYPFRQFRGRHLFLANGDWSWELFKRTSRNAMLKTGFSVVAFTDFGLAWDAETYDLAHRKPAWDAGLGFGTTDETLRVYFARDLRAERSPIHVTVRIARAY